MFATNPEEIKNVGYAYDACVESPSKSTVNENLIIPRNETWNFQEW